MSLQSWMSARGQSPNGSNSISTSSQRAKSQQQHRQSTTNVSPTPATTRQSATPAPSITRTNHSYNDYNAPEPTYTHSYEDYSAGAHTFDDINASTGYSNYVATSDYTDSVFAKKNVDVYDASSWFAHTAADVSYDKTGTYIPPALKTPMSTSSSKSDMKSERSAASTSKADQARSSDLQRIEAEMVALKEAFLRSMSDATLSDDRVRRIESALERLESSSNQIASRMRLDPSSSFPAAEPAVGTAIGDKPIGLRDIETLLVDLTDSMEMRTSRIAKMVHEVQTRNDPKEVLQALSDIEAKLVPQPISTEKIEDIKQHIKTTIEESRRNKDPVQLHSMSTLKSDVSHLQESVERMTTELKSIDETMDIVAQAQQSLATLCDERFPTKTSRESPRCLTDDIKPLMEQVESSRTVLKELKTVCEDSRNDITVLRQRMDDMIRKVDCPSPSRASVNSPFAERLARLTEACTEIQQGQTLLVKRVEEVTKSVLHDMLLARPRGNPEEAINVTKSISELKSCISDLEGKLSLMSKESQTGRDINEGNMTRISEGMKRLQRVVGDFVVSERNPNIENVKDALKSELTGKMDVILDAIEMVKRITQERNVNHVGHERNINDKSSSDRVLSLLESTHNTIVSYLPVNLEQQLEAIQNSLAHLTTTTSSRYDPSSTSSSPQRTIKKDVSGSILAHFEDQARRERQSAESLDSIQHTLSRLVEWTDLNGINSNSKSSSPNRRAASVPVSTQQVTEIVPDTISTELNHLRRVLLESNSVIDLEKRRADLTLEISNLLATKSQLVEQVGKLEAQARAFVGIDAETPPQSFATSKSTSPARDRDTSAPVTPKPRAATNNYSDVDSTNSSAAASGWTIRSFLGGNIGKSDE
ncbi:hypothetical protein SmJEL517_g02223 [Synchytrium microbalum]|uniref:Uncharacterized protein n=1 Tax=Synchytrium microbalum TaxID=1806994 RepID=A0A507C2L3_9FUNG|nr:uncharacterized protein SmJEL517_g02223 [Synchytrium microbalum]TPX35367.1 hypothetical protein SmJEL517_g02223 [Synchytrium microbalum]